MHWILYEGTKTFMYPNGAIADPERVREDYPATALFPFIILTDPSEQVLYSIENLSSARANYGIDPQLSDSEALEAINAAEQQLRQRAEEPVEADPMPTPEERIAAALEFLNVMSMDDLEEGV